MRFDRSRYVLAMPLLAAALVQWRDWSLTAWRRGLELLALAGFLFLLLLRVGGLLTVVDLLFLLCGVRLCLPRDVPQRRQLLLMGFLLFITTAVSTADLDFLLPGLRLGLRGGSRRLGLGRRFLRR